MSSFSHLVSNLVLLADDVDVTVVLVADVLGVEKVDPILLVGILVGVPSSLIRDKVDPCRDAGLEVLGVKLDLTGIEVRLVNVVNVLEGVRRPNDAESE